MIAKRIQRFFGSTRRSEAKRLEDPSASMDEGAGDAQLEMACALVFGFEERAQRLGLAEHCTRVMRIARHLADRLSVAPVHTRALVRAAQLHELGMVAVPAELVENPRPITSDEVCAVRAQARIGAELVRRTQGHLVADLIEHQYCDLPDLTAHFHPESPEYRLAGILRVADLYDTTMHPRPYQRDLTRANCQAILTSGQGGRYHPDAVEVLLETARG